MDIKYKIGLRSIKTVVAVFLCLITGISFRNHSMFYSSIAAVICMQQTTEESVHVGLHRFVGTIIGGIFGFIVLKLFEMYLIAENVYVIVVPIFLLGLIYFCNVIEKKEAVSISCIVFLSIVTNLNRGLENTEVYVFFRVIDTVIGIVWAVFVNKFLDINIFKYFIK